MMFSDIFPRLINSEMSHNMPYPTPEYSDNPLPSHIDDSITSLMNMADNMDSLLPPELSLDHGTNLPNDFKCPSPTPSKQQPITSSIDPVTSLLDAISSVTRSPPDASTVVDLTPGHNAVDAPLCFLSNSTKSEETSLDLCSSPDTPPYGEPVDVKSGTPHRISVLRNAPLPFPHTQPYQSALDLKQEVHLSTANDSIPDYPSPSSHNQELPNVQSWILSQTSSSALLTSSIHPMTPPEDYTISKAVGSPSALPTRSPVSSGVASPNKAQTISRVAKPRKMTRKPKTYSKPVASRFCHICSRMPRRGQGSATCRRMAEGFCRKIVCEQCIREQGWDFDSIASSPASWLCPHCANMCPARSQCHIYNRINARRKRSGSASSAKQTTSTAAASAAMICLSVNGIKESAQDSLFADLNAPTMRILQPPPNFRLNLPPQYNKL